MSLPCGVGHAEILFGLQIIGQFRGDARALDAAAAAEREFARGRALRVPPPDLYRQREPAPKLRSIATDLPVYPA
ncbi:MAG TPA: hypothetical protein VL689_12345 [Paraburkholderia sp.]|jgi:amidase|nr:hypothetical protein [Paraburkholderia sp.]